MAPSPAGMALPITYRFFFLIFEPWTALLGAAYAHYRQHEYLTMTHSASAPAAGHDIPTATSVVLSQLANLYFFFTLNEALVLRSTSDLRVWRTLLFGLLVADFGHLWSLRPLGHHVYWDVAAWNAMDVGNVFIVYLGASMRVAFLLGVGLSSSPRPERNLAKVTDKIR